jgi:hypothetical protein
MCNVSHVSRHSMKGRIGQAEPANRFGGGCRRTDFVVIFHSPARSLASNSSARAAANRPILPIHLVNVAIAPVLARLEGFDDRMPGCIEVLSSVFILARIAAADVSATAAQPQMHPRIARPQTIFAARRARRDFTDLIKVRTSWIHCDLPFFFLICWSAKLS